MKNFIVLYHMPMAAMANASPEDMKNSMEPWMAWASKCGSALVDFGTPLANGQKLSKSGNSSSDKNVIGYSILQAENIEGAIALLQGHPHLEFADSCEIEVHESMPPPM